MLSRFALATPLVLSVLAGLSHGALVATNFTVGVPSASSNRLTLSLLDDSTTTDLSGSFQAILDINQFTGAISSLELTTGNIATTDWTLMPTGVGTISTLNNSATVDTPAPPDPVIGNSFDSSAHQVIINSGTLLRNGGVMQDFSVTPLVIPGFGSGTITSTPGTGVFDISIRLGINSTQQILGQNLNVAGDLVATGQVSAVPEPTSIALFSLVCGRLAFCRRRASR